MIFCITESCLYINLFDTYLVLLACEIVGETYSYSIECSCF